MPALVLVLAGGGRHPRERRDRYLGHVDMSMDGRYTHALDHQLLDDALTLGEYLRRGDTPSRIGSLDTRPEAAREEAR